MGGRAGQQVGQTANWQSAQTQVLPRYNVEGYSGFAGHQYQPHPVYQPHLASSVAVTEDNEEAAAAFVRL